MLSCPPLFQHQALAHSVKHIHVLCIPDSRHPCHSTDQATHTPRTHERIVSSPNPRAQKHNKWFREAECSVRVKVAITRTWYAPLQPLLLLLPSQHCKEKEHQQQQTNSTCNACGHPTCAACRGDSQGHTCLIKRAATTNKQHMQHIWASHMCSMQRRQPRAHRSG